MSPRIVQPSALVQFLVVTRFVTLDSSLIPKLDVAGSNPVSGLGRSTRRGIAFVPETAVHARRVRRRGRGVVRVTAIVNAKIRTA